MNLLVVDNHAVVRAGFAQLFSERPEARVRYATTSQEALRFAQEIRPDVIVLDLDIPEIGGFALLKRLRLEVKDSRVLIATMYSDITYVNLAIEMGAIGYVTKNASPEELLMAVDHANAGKRYIEASICQTIVHRSLNAKDHSFELSSRDIDVIRLLASGKSVGK
jgi:two-component system invasion response regulator UvrY